MRRAYPVFWLHPHTALFCKSRCHLDSYCKQDCLSYSLSFNSVFQFCQSTMPKGCRSSRMSTVVSTAASSSSSLRGQGRGRGRGRGRTHSTTTTTPRSLQSRMRFQHDPHALLRRLLVWTYQPCSSHVPGTVA